MPKGVVQVMMKKDFGYKADSWPYLEWPDEIKPDHELSWAWFWKERDIIITNEEIEAVIWQTKESLQKSIKE